MISKTTVSSSSAVSAGWPVMHTHADPSASLLEALFTSNPQQGALSSWFPPSFLSSPPWLCPACGMMLSWPIAQMHGFFGLFSIRQVRDGGPAFPSFQSHPHQCGWAACQLLRSSFVSALTDVPQPLGRCTFCHCFVWLFGGWSCACSAACWPQIQGSVVAGSLPGLACFTYC